MFFIATDMLFERSTKLRKRQIEEDDQNEDLSLFLLVLHLLVGPGSITSLILIASTIPGWLGIAHVILTMLGVVAIAM